MTSSSGQRLPIEVLVSSRMIAPEMRAMPAIVFLAESLEMHSDNSCRSHLNSDASSCLLMKVSATLLNCSRDEKACMMASLNQKGGLNYVSSKFSAKG